MHGGEDVVLSEKIVKDEDELKNLQRIEAHEEEENWDNENWIDERVDAGEFEVIEKQKDLMMENLKKVVRINLKDSLFLF